MVDGIYQLHMRLVAALILIAAVWHEKGYMKKSRL